MSGIIFPDKAVILVTGASGEIGRETARQISLNGATVILSGRDRNRLKDTVLTLDGRPCQIESFDLAEIDAIPDWLKTITAKTGPLYGLAHCAGISATVPIRLMKWEKADEVMRANWGVSWALGKAFRQKGVHTEGDSRIVMVSSTAGLVGEGAMSAYCSSKGAMIALARALAVELVPEGIRVNTVAPGFIATEMNRRYLASISEEQLRLLKLRHPLGFGTTTDVAAAVTFLLTSGARWITGTTIAVDGGLTSV